jgi:hypothetical protein
VTFKGTVFGEVLPEFGAVDRRLPLFRLLELRRIGSSRPLTAAAPIKSMTYWRSRKIPLQNIPKTVANDHEGWWTNLRLDGQFNWGGALWRTSVPAISPIAWRPQHACEPHPPLTRLREWKTRTGHVTRVEAYKADLTWEQKLGVWFGQPARISTSFAPRRGTMRVPSAAMTHA